MKVLGIHDVICAGAATLTDGKVDYATHEERFTRLKNDDSFPRQAILAAGDHEYDIVAFPSQLLDFEALLTHSACRYKIEDYIREQHEFWKPKFYENKNPEYLQVFKDKIDLQRFGGRVTPQNYKSLDPKEIRKELLKEVLPNAKNILFFEHHNSHAAYAYYGSPFRGEDVLIVTIDGHGDGLNATVSVPTKKGIERVFQTNNFNLARMYRYSTLLLGMKPNEHEYKVMGLAPYAKEPILRKAYQIYKETLQVDGINFKYAVKPSDSYFYFQKKFEGLRFDGIAGALQKWTEEILCQWIKNLMKHFGKSRLVISGGVAMNIKAMGKIGELDEVKDLFVCGSGSDESLCIGAAYLGAEHFYVQQNRDPNLQIQPMESMYLGPSYDRRTLDQQMESWSNRGAYEVIPKPDVQRLAQILADGKVLARCEGPMEFGQRSLGNRSIIADARRREIVPKINDKIKSRDFWMPFAPMVLDEDVQRYLVNPKNFYSPFMTVGFETTLAAQEDLVAGLHPADKTARPQMLKRSSNPELYDFLKAYKDITGVGAILNTSFNLHGHPIVYQPKDAFFVLDNSDLDGLITSHYLILRKEK